DEKLPHAVFRGTVPVFSGKAALSTQTARRLTSAWAKRRLCWILPQLRCLAHADVSLRAVCVDIAAFPENGHGATKYCMMQLLV
ncbi:MAG: hypothetical protein ACKPKO_58700, partial [Candidatus Fonsibacter sp.]